VIRPKLRPCLSRGEPPGEAQRRASERGFTLIELTAVVIIISIFAAMAIPQITQRLRDRRTQEAAQRIGLMYQQARIRAMGQGGAVMLRYTVGTNSQGLFEIRDALSPVSAQQKCGLVPSVSCTATIAQWDTTGSFRPVQTMEINKEYGGDVYSSLVSDTGTVASTMDVCFTPLGRSFVRYATGSAWTALAGIPRFTVTRKISGGAAVGLSRKILILPTGIARLEL
jgi:type IV fimbrial biogenesis protein FimT